MKRLFALLITALLLVSLLVMPASAEGDEIPFWITHYNNGSVEGAGVIFTDADTAGTWWHHISFAPVEGAENVYEIVAVCFGDGNAYALEIPEGGFVYAVNSGNNWPALFEQHGATGDGATGQWFDDADHAAMPDYTSQSCTDCFNMVGTWSTGMIFEFNGLDLEDQSIPTSTDDKQWYDDGYTCTATIAIYTGDDTEDPATSEDVSEDVSEDASTETSETVSTETSEEASTATSTDASEEASENGGAASEDAATSTDASEEPTTTEEGGLSTGALIAIIAGAVVVIGVIVLVVVKSKKK